MKIALVTTTINVPTVLSLYRAIGPHVRFFVAFDEKTPEDAVNFCTDVDNLAPLFLSGQQKWKCSEPIGWNCIQRRNIATLEAIAWGADIIVSIDDDNIPISAEYFTHITRALAFPHRGIKVHSYSKWFDPGEMLETPARHRGFPLSCSSNTGIAASVNSKVGVAAGYCLGDPDVDAVTRIAQHPTVRSVCELARPGFVVDNDIWTVFNSQNTAFLGKFAPLMFMWPGVGRYDDIFASLVCQRVMREHGYHVHFGQPYVWQQRNKHNLFKDLQAEMLGMEHVVEFAEHLDTLTAAEVGPLVPVVQAMRAVCHHLARLEWFPVRAIQAGLAWCDDIEGVTGA